jgi:hypothetical protein
MEILVSNPQRSALRRSLDRSDFTQNNGVDHQYALTVAEGIEC